MKKQIYVIGLIALVGFISTNQAYSQNSAILGLYEDQALVCLKDLDAKTQVEVCKVVQILDLLTEKQQVKLHNELFGNNQDTFSIEELD